MWQYLWDLVHEASILQIIMVVIVIVASLAMCIILRDRLQTERQTELRQLEEVATKDAERIPDIIDTATESDNLRNDKVEKIKQKSKVVSSTEPLLQPKDEQREKVETLKEVMNSIRIFKFLDESIQQALSSQFQTKRVTKGEVLYGRKEDGEILSDTQFLYVVLHGKIHITVDTLKEKAEQEADLVEKDLAPYLSTEESTSSGFGAESSSQKPGAIPKQKPKLKKHKQDLLAVVEKGQCATSMLSVLDAATQYVRDRVDNLLNHEDDEEPLEDENENEVITAFAVEDSIVGYLPLSVVSFLQQKFPREVNRVVKTIIIRLQRITMLSINRYFGLNRELVNRDHHSVKPGDLPKAYLLSNWKDIAVGSFTKLMNLDPNNEAEKVAIQLLRDGANLETYKPGDILMKPPEDDSEDEGNPSLYLVLKGFVRVYLHEEDRSDISVEGAEIDHGLAEDESLAGTNGHLLYASGPGSTVGQLAVITGDFYYRVVAGKTDKDVHGEVIVVRISKSTVDMVVKYCPDVHMIMVRIILLQLAPLTRQVDHAVDWQHRDAGELVYKEKDETDSMYIVMSGRLRAFNDTSKTNHKKMEDDSLFGTRNSKIKQNIVGEFGRGDSLGALEVLTGQRRPHTLIAVRDSELAKISSTVFKLIVKRFPKVIIRFSRIIGYTLRLHTENNSRRIFNQATARISTVAVMAAEPSIPLGDVTAKICEEVSHITSCLHLDKNAPLQRFGKEASSGSDEVSLTRWLASMEERYKIVIYECEKVLSRWTSRCLRQADLILIVGWGTGNPAISNLERYLLENPHQLAARKELVLLHPVGSSPSGTLQWIVNRKGWCHAVHHVRLETSPLSKEKPDWHNKGRVRARADSVRNFIKEEIFRAGNLINRMRGKKESEMTLGERLFPHTPKGDFARIARRVTGTSIGLVLGGGGARGIAHVGVIRALEEEGIPIDMIGGTSIGALMGALFAQDPEFFTFMSKAKKFCKMMSNPINKILDLTYPRTSFFAGKEFNNGIQEAIGITTQIEDLWLNYFNISTNITHSKMMVHRNGPLWRYVRASMTLAGFLPPIPDTDEDACLLVDGGYVNNLPADVMRSLGAHTVLAVDVGAEADTNYFNYGDYLSGWWQLWNKFNPFEKRAKIPNMSDIQDHLAYVSCVQQLEEVKKKPYCIYMRPPIAQFGTLDFGRFEEISNIGFEYTKAQIKQWKAKADEELSVTAASPNSQQRIQSPAINMTRRPRRALNRTTTGIIMKPFPPAKEHSNKQEEKVKEKSEDKKEEAAPPAEITAPLPEIVEDLQKSKSAGIIEVSEIRRRDSF